MLFFVIWWDVDLSSNWIIRLGLIINVWGTSIVSRSKIHRTTNPCREPSISPAFEPYRERLFVGRKPLNLGWGRCRCWQGAGGFGRSSFYRVEGWILWRLVCEWRRGGWIWVTSGNHQTQSKTLSLSRVPVICNSAFTCRLLPVCWFLLWSCRAPNPQMNISTLLLLPFILLYR